MIPANSRDNQFMDRALNLARTAGTFGEVPIGALVVSHEGHILGEGYNLVETYHCQSYHAEVQAIQNACEKQCDWRLGRSTLYVTIEPCMMCISLCALSRIERVVYGAASPLFGYHLDKEGILTLYTKNIKNITSGVKAAEAALLVKEFFKKERHRE